MHLIPRRDFDVEPMRSPLTPIQVDEVIKRFMECGDTRTIADEFDVKTKIIRDIVQGKNWKEYTGIKDEEFYNKYVRWAPSATNEEILKIAEMYKNGMELKEIYKNFPNIKRSFISSVVNGRKLTQFTKLPKTDLKMKPLSVEDIDMILKLNQQGLVRTQIAKKIGFSSSTVDKVLNGEIWSEYTGITPDNPAPLNKIINLSLNKQQIEEIKKKKEQGVSKRKIIEEYHIGVVTLNKILDGYYD